MKKNEFQLFKEKYCVILFIAFTAVLLYMNIWNRDEKERERERERDKINEKNAAVCVCVDLNCIESSRIELSIN